MLRAVRRPRALVGALALLVALPLTTWQGTARAAGPEDTATTLELVTADPAYGDLVTVTAPVVTDPGGIPVSNGEVTFHLAATQGALGSGVTLGPIVVDGGTAYLEIDTTTLPFLDAQSDGFWVAAEYAPSEGSTSYATAYNASASDPLYVDLTTVPTGPSGTATSVSAPGAARVGTPVTLGATVSPAFATGAVQFSVDGAPVGAPVPVSNGTASLAHAFTTGGPHTVGAAFVPTDSAAFWGSTAVPATVAVIHPTTTTVTGPGAARKDAPTTLTATVTPAAAAGTVLFSVDGEQVGAPVPVAGGVASVPHTFTRVGAATVRATFAPTDAAAYDGSSDAAGLAVTVGKVETSVAITGPDHVAAGALTEFTATVTPVGVPGRVTFRFENRNVVTVAVDENGAAVASHRFVSLAPSVVTAIWKPSDAASYERAEAPAHEVEVRPGTTATEFFDFLTASMSSLTYVAPCDGAQGDGPARAADSSVYTILIYAVGKIFEVLRLIFDVINLRFRAILCGTGTGRAAPVEGTVECQLTDAGIECPLELPAFSRLTISGALPVPADLAGTGVESDAVLSVVDPETGESTPLSTEQTTIRVPRRTVLSARLAPVRSAVDSVGRGRQVDYRLTVRNRGVVTADRVRACVSVGRGAVLGSRRACWSLPPLAAGDRATRSFTVVAPRRKGWLDLTAVVRPRPAQADPVRLAVALPVT